MNQGEKLAWSCQLSSNTPDFFFFDSAPGFKLECQDLTIQITDDTITGWYWV